MYLYVCGSARARKRARVRARRVAHATWHTVPWTCTRVAAAMQGIRATRGGDAPIDGKGRFCVGLEMRIDRPRNEKVLAFHKVRVIVDDLITLQCQERAR